MKKFCNSLLLVCFCIFLGVGLIGCGTTPNEENNGKVECEYVTFQKKQNGVYTYLYVDVRLTNKTSNETTIYVTDFTSTYANLNNNPNYYKSIDLEMYTNYGGSELNSFSLNVNENRQVTLKFSFYVEYNINLKLNYKGNLVKSLDVQWN